MVEGFEDIVRDIIREIFISIVRDRRIKCSDGLIIGVPMIGDDG